MQIFAYEFVLYLYSKFVIKFMNDPGITSNKKAEGDAINSYFECITECSIIDGHQECITRCLEIHLKRDNQNE